jgi:addiction module HigA family antidote
MKPLPNIHPGEVLLEEFLLLLGISQNALARAAGVPPRRINEIVLGKRSVTADTAVRLAATLGTTERFWLGLQADFDLEDAHRALGQAVARIERIAACWHTPPPMRCRKPTAARRSASVAACSARWN